MPARPSLRSLAEALESVRLLDAPGKAVGKRVRGALRPGLLKDAISGTWLGHALHPVLTDVVIGSWTSASLLDLLGGDDDGKASERLIMVGIAAYAPTALAGMSDWADTEIADPGVRRVGLVHAASNSVALSLYASSLVARLRGDRGRGRALAAGGAAVLGVGGFLGGHLTLAQGVGANQTAFDEGPEDWTPAIASAELPEAAPTRAVVQDTPVLLLRERGELFAVHDRCSHRGCSLSDGELEGELITCPCHGSQFSCRDGSVHRGPATVPQPAYEVRESAGRIELRLPPRS